VLRAAWVNLCSAGHNTPQLTCNCNVDARYHSSAYPRRIIVLHAAYLACPPPPRPPPHVPQRRVYTHVLRGGGGARLTPGNTGRISALALAWMWHHVTITARAQLIRGLSLGWTASVDRQIGCSARAPHTVRAFPLIDQEMSLHLGGPPQTYRGETPSLISKGRGP
jgi:hypothetical protein